MIENLIKTKNPLECSNGFLKYDYIHTINTSLESNNENDGGVVELITY
jgi:hypothetical protein